jgi:hypothetical protein
MINIWQSIPHLSKHKTHLFSRFITWKIAAHLVITHTIKQVMYRYCLENWRLWRGVSYKWVNMVCLISVRCVRITISWDCMKQLCPSTWQWEKRIITISVTYTAAKIYVFLLDCIFHKACMFCFSFSSQNMILSLLYNRCWVSSTSKVARMWHWPPTPIYCWG